MKSEFDSEIFCITSLDFSKSRNAKPRFDNSSTIPDIQFDDLVRRVEVVFANPIAYFDEANNKCSLFIKSSALMFAKNGATIPCFLLGTEVCVGICNKNSCPALTINLTVSDKLFEYCGTTKVTLFFAYYACDIILVRIRVEEHN